MGEPLAGFFKGLFNLIARRLHGPMPSIDHLSDAQRDRLSNRTFDRDLTAIGITVVGGLALMVVVVTVLLVFHWFPIIPIAGLSAVLTLGAWGILRYGRDRRDTISELHRMGALPICPTCGYDLRATPDRCPECGDGNWG